MAAVYTNAALDRESVAERAATAREACGINTLTAPLALSF